eukprot:1584238-Pleurochrysis_carterae.AAC.3
MSRGRCSSSRSSTAAPTSTSSTTARFLACCACALAWPLSLFRVGCSDMRAWAAAKVSRGTRAGRRPSAVTRGVDEGSGQTG